MLRHWNILCVVVVVVFCVRCVLHHTGGLANSGEDLHSNCKMADASRGPGRPPKKRSGSKKAENVPGAKLQKVAMSYMRRPGAEVGRLKTSTHFWKRQSVSDTVRKCSRF